MGREIKRVALDFDWPLKKVWHGYWCPYSGAECPWCEGRGLSKFALELDDQWYDFHGRYNERLCENLTQEDIDALVAEGRLRDFTRQGVHPTADEVNTWERHGRGIGHDAINRMVVIEHRCKRAGEPYLCDRCDGEGCVWQPGVKELAEAWEPIEPPSGEGWQVWETVSEGAPVTPVFSTGEELVDYIVSNGLGGIFGSISREAAEQFVMRSGWAPSGFVHDGVVVNGIEGLK